MSGTHDAIVVGAGPAGSVCAANLALGGMRVLLVDREHFPRNKVCGDCLNPSVWPILDRLGLRQHLLSLPHVVAREVRYLAIDTDPIRIPIPNDGETVVRRREFDAMLLQRAIDCGVEFRPGIPVNHIASGWTIETPVGQFSAPMLFAADGRNSTVARLVGLLPRIRRERIAIQCHCLRPPWHGEEMRMFFYPGGYGGTAPIDSSGLVICLVSHPASVNRVRNRAIIDFALDDSTEWRSIAPLSRPDPATIAADGLFLLGDAARVVEPITGEGIYYAMRSGEIAAECALARADAEAAYRTRHRAMYRGRLWINRIVRLAALNPRAASLALKLSHLWPVPLRAVTTRVVTQT